MAVRVDLGSTTLFFISDQQFLFLFGWSESERKERSHLHWRADYLLKKLGSPSSLKSVKVCSCRALTKNNKEEVVARQIKHQFL